MRFRDFFTPSRWRSFIIWVLKSIIKVLAKDEVEYNLDFYEIEQYMFRMLRCPDCVAAGECTHCGCDIKGRMMNRHDYCSAIEEDPTKWGPFMDKESWENFKEINKIEFKLVSKWKS